MQIENQRGTAALEAISVVLLIFTFASGILLAAYLIFAKAWIQFQSEQALFCASESRISFACKNNLDRKLKAFLPWGESASHVLAGQDNWKVEVQWKYGKYAIRSVKVLDAKQILKAKVSPW